MSDNHAVRDFEKDAIALLRKATFDNLVGQDILKKFTHAMLVLNMDKGFNGESDESRFRMQVRAGLGFAAFVLARRKLPAVKGTTCQSQDTRCSFTD